MNATSGSLSSTLRISASWGEAGTLPDLSIDDVPEYDGKLSKTVQRLNQQQCSASESAF
jgi:hypothetical protein